MYHSRLPSSKSTLSYQLIAFDVGTAFIAPVLALYLRDPALFGSVHSEGIAIYVSVGGGISVLFFILFRLAHGLPRFFSFHDAIEIAKGSACAVAGTAILPYAFTRLDAIPRSTSAIYFLVLVAALIAGRVVRRITIRRREIGSVFDIRHDEERNVIIVGAGHLAWFYTRLLDSFAIDNRRAVGILDDNESLHGGSMFGHVILGGTAEAATVLDDFAQHGIEISAFVICEPNKERALALSNRLESLCQDRGLQLELLAEKLGVLKGPSEEEAGDRPTLRPIFPKSNYFHIKRPIEATIATFALLILSPLFILVGLLVLISLGSPVLFGSVGLAATGALYGSINSRQCIIQSIELVDCLGKARAPQVLASFFAHRDSTSFPSSITSSTATWGSSVQGLSCSPISLMNRQFASLSRPELRDGHKFTAASLSAPRKRTTWTSGTYTMHHCGSI